MRRTSPSMVTSLRRTANESCGSSDSNRSPSRVNVNVPWQSRSRCLWVTAYTTCDGLRGSALLPAFWRGVARCWAASVFVSPAAGAGADSRCRDSLLPDGFDRCWFSKCPSSPNTMSTETTIAQTSARRGFRMRRSGGCSAGDEGAVTGRDYSWWWEPPRRPTAKKRWITGLPPAWPRYRVMDARCSTRASRNRTPWGAPQCPVVRAPWRHVEPGLSPARTRGTYVRYPLMGLPEC